MILDIEKPRVVIDTNVYISGVTYPGRSGEILELMVRDKIKVYISPFIIHEIQKVLKDKFGWNVKVIDRFITFLKKKTILVEPKITLSVIVEKDDDNRILECAVDRKVQYLITGDKKHLLPLKSYRGVKIVSPGEFLQLI